MVHLYKTYRRIFRYTPYEDYYGKVSFWNTISDINGNLATASVYISVLNIPPQFASVPSQLQATEDLVLDLVGSVFAAYINIYEEIM
jgi:hypothetical protein